MCPKYIVVKCDGTPFFPDGTVHGVRGGNSAEQAISNLESAVSIIPSTRQPKLESVVIYVYRCAQGRFEATLADRLPEGSGPRKPSKPADERKNIDLTDISHSGYPCKNPSGLFPGFGGSSKIPYNGPIKIDPKDLTNFNPDTLKKFKPNYSKYFDNPVGDNKSPDKDNKP